MLQSAKSKNENKMSAYTNFLPRVSESDFNFESARRAYYWTSFDPDKRGRNDIKGIVNDLNALADEFESHVKSDDQKQRAIDEYSRFIQKYKSFQTALWSAKSRTASTMITGGANFNVRQNEKALNVEQRRRTDFIEWENKARKRAIQTIKGAAPEEVKSLERWSSIEKEVLSYIGTVIDIEKNKAPYSKQLITGGFKRFLMKIHKQGFQVEFNKSLSLIREYQDKEKITVFAKNNPIWALEAEPESGQVVENKAKETIFEAKGLEVVRDFQEDRVRMYFDGKPAPETIALLKRNSFKWSPYNKAWQRQNTQNGVNAAMTIAKQLFPNVTAKPTSKRRKLAAPTKARTAKKAVKPAPKPTSRRRKLATPAKARTAKKTVKPAAKPAASTRKKVAAPKRVTKTINQNERLKRAARALVKPTGIKLDGTLKKGYTRLKNGDVVKKSLVKKCPTTPKKTVRKSTKRK